MKNRIHGEQGLYPKGNESELIEQRARIQAHNREVLRLAVKQILEMPVPFGSTEGIKVPLPDLWINQESGSSAPNRYQLQLRVTQPDNGRDALIFRLSIQDKQIGKLCQIDRFFVRDAIKRAVSITGSIGTELGYEGNGLGTALVGIEAEVLAKVSAQLRELSLHPADNGPFYLKIRDTAQPMSAELGLAESSGPSDREGWTTRTYWDVYPNILLDRSKIIAKIGFYPHSFNPRSDLLLPILPAKKG